MTYSAAQLVLKAHLEAEAEEVSTKIASGEYQWACTYTTDLDHWADCDVYSVEDLEMYDLRSYISDTAKEVYGSRSMGRTSPDATLAELKAQAKDLDIRAGEVQEQEEKEQKACIKEFEDRVQMTIDMGAEDKDTAMRWILDAEGWGDYTSLDSICYRLNLPYGYLDAYLPSNEAA